MYHVDLNPDGYIILKNENDKKKIEGKTKKYKNFFAHSFSVYGDYTGIDWMGNINSGFAIKNVNILLKMKNGKYKYLSNKNIRKTPYKIRNTYYFLSSTILHFDIPYKDVEKVIVLGKFICPVKPKELRKIIYGY